jgi:hypothetical protein
MDFGINHINTENYPKIITKLQWMLMRKPSKTYSKI